MFQVNLMFQLPLTNGVSSSGSSSQLSRPACGQGRAEREYTDCPGFANKKFLRANYILFKTLKRRCYIIENSR